MVDLSPKIDEKSMEISTKNGKKSHGKKSVKKDVIFEPVLAWNGKRVYLKKS